MHPNNLHQDRYDLDKLCRLYPDLNNFVFVNKYGDKTINFSDNKAVIALNTALLKAQYHIEYWKIPKQHLCPAIPGRADYIHHINDLIQGVKKATILDIGTGSSIIYPLLGNAIYQWKFVGSEIDPNSIENAETIIKKNKLESQISLRKQKHPNNILNGIIEPGDYFDACMCNPPFYKSEKEALQANLRKQRGLKKGKAPNKNIENRNFSGVSNELWYSGGEKAFVKKYIIESRKFQLQVGWFSSLISNKKNLPFLLNELKKAQVKESRTLAMQQGNKSIHILAWKYKKHSNSGN